MKEKTIILFECQEQKLWNKGMKGDSKKADYILISELPDEEKFLYSSTIETSISKKYEKNSCLDIRSIRLFKNKGDDKKYLKVITNDDKEICLDNEIQFILLCITDKNIDGNNESVLVFRVPKLLEEKVYEYYFDADKNGEDALGIFWLIKEFF